MSGGVLQQGDEESWDEMNDTLYRKSINTLLGESKYGRKVSRRKESKWISLDLETRLAADNTLL